MNNFFLYHVIKYAASTNERRFLFFARSLFEYLEVKNGLY